MTTPEPRRRTSLRSGSVPYPTVDIIKALLGIPPEDTSKDDAIALVLAACLAMLENYCGRTFQEGDYTEEFPPLDTRNRTLLLRAWPVQTVNTVTRDDGIAITDWRLIPQTGQLQQWRRHWFRHWPEGGCWWWDNDAVVIVDYTGGYPDDAWPADLVGVLLGLFGARWAATGGDPSKDTTGKGGIKSFTVDGVRIDYDMGDASTGATTGVESGDIPPELAPFAAQLDPYVSRRAYGV